MTRSGRGARMYAIGYQSTALTGFEPGSMLLRIITTACMICVTPWPRESHLQELRAISIPTTSPFGFVLFKQVVDGS